MRKLHTLAAAIWIGLIHGVAMAELQPVDAKASLFPLSSVHLLDGPFLAAQQVDLKYILAHDVDRLLAPFRHEAGLPPKAEHYPNWESSGLDGHTSGHYLSALAMMFASTGDAECKRRMDYMVGEIAECQKASGNGYVGGVRDGRALWADVAAGKLNVSGFAINDRWVPWYNLHKLFAGLRDAYLIGHNEQAKTVLIGLAGWCDELLSHLSDEQVQQMLRAEHGGMTEVLADVASIAGERKYLALAKRFTDRAILTPLVEGRDELTGKHANTQIPKVIGFERIASLTGESDGHHAAEFFWENVTGKRSVAIGGNSVDEHFHPTNDFSRMLENRTGPETCNTYNMLRLSEALFEADPQARYADFYERALYNHILSSQDPVHGGFVYFTPMRPRHYRVYSSAEKCFWCCVGTGFENHARYGQFIYAHHNDTLFVNLFVASELKWPEKGVALKQETRFPDEPSTRLTLTLDAPSTLELKIRVPAWAEGFEVHVNDSSESIAATPSSFVSIKREWKSGDRIDVRLPLRVAAERLPDGSDFVAFRYGPIVLAAATGTEDLKGLFADDGRGDHIAEGRMLPLNEAPVLVMEKPADVAAKVMPVSGALSFSIDPSVIQQTGESKELRLIPFFRLHESRYVVYWHLLTPGKLAEEQKRLEAFERERMALEARTVDRVAPGEQQSEVDHGFKGEQTQNGTHLDRSWRDARGWFSYELDAPAKPAELQITIFNGDRDRNFDVLIDGKKLAEIKLKGEGSPNGFTVLSYALPQEFTNGTRKSFALKFAAQAGSVAGGIYEIRVVTAGDEAKPVTK